MKRLNWPVGALLAVLAVSAGAIPVRPDAGAPQANAPAAAKAAPAAAVSPFIIDPGHGGSDFGAFVDGRREKDIALAIAKKVKERLEDGSGLPARLTRDSDVFVPLNERVDESLAGEAFVSLHLNEARSRRRHGITVYAFGNGLLRRRYRRRRRRVPPLAAPPRQEERESAALAQFMVRSLRARGFTVDAPARAHFYVLKNPAIPSILIEMGYLSNPKEAARLADPSYQDQLADAIASTLRAYAVEDVAARSPRPRLTASLTRRRGKKRQAAAGNGK